MSDRPTGSTSYGRIADRYEQLRGGPERARLIVDALRPFLPGTNTLCEVGVGTGIIAEHLETSDLKVIGFDVSEEMLGQSAVRLPGRVGRADGAALPLVEGAVDAVLFVWVLHHVGDLQATIREAARVTRAGGRVIALSGFVDASEDDIDPIMRSLDADLRPDRWAHSDAVTATAAAAGLRIEHSDRLVIRSRSTPEATATSIEERLYSQLWDLDEFTWQSVVVPRIERLRNLPDPGRPRERAMPHPLWVWRRTRTTPAPLVFAR